MQEFKNREAFIATPQYKDTEKEINNTKYLQNNLKKYR